MVDDLTRQGVQTVKALGEACIEGIKVMAALLNILARKIQNCDTEADKNKCIGDFNKQVDMLLKGEMPVGEFTKEVKDSVVMQIPDDVVADMFESELRFQSFDYSRMSDTSFVVRSSDVEVLNHVMQETAVKLNDVKDLSQEQIKEQAKENLKFAKKGKTKEQVEKITKNKAKVKEVVKNLKEKSEKKDHNRERQKQKAKNKEAER